MSGTDGLVTGGVPGLEIDLTQVGMQAFLSTSNCSKNQQSFLSVDLPGSSWGAIHQGGEADAGSGHPDQRVQGAGRARQGQGDAAAGGDRDKGRGGRPATRQPELHLRGGRWWLRRFSKQ